MTRPLLVLLLISSCAGCTLFRNDPGLTGEDTGAPDARRSDLDASNPDGPNDDGGTHDGNGLPTVTPDGNFGTGDGGTDGDGGDATRNDGGLQPDDGGGFVALCQTSFGSVDTSSPDRIVGTGTADSCTYAALEQAIAAGGIITFDCGGPTSIEVPSALVVTTETVLDGGGDVTLSGGGSSRILEIDELQAASRPEVTLQNLTLRDGWVDTSDNPCGGAIFRKGGTLNLIDVTFLNNRCEGEGDGGALYSVGDKKVRMLRTSFRGNSAREGGAVRLKAANVEVIESEFVGNSATTGGGIASNGPSLEMCGTDFEDNSATDGGGGLMHTFDSPGSILVDHAVFARNTAGTITGGAFVFGEGMITIRSSSFVDNTAATSAGLRIQRGTIDIENVTIARNIAEAGQAGGLALYDDLTNGSVHHATIVDNGTLADLTFEGGIGGTTTIELSNSIISENYGKHILSPQNCGETHSDGGGNLQFPENRDDGNPDRPCTDGVVFGDPLLSPTQDGLTYVPAASSPAVGLGSDCATYDQLGTARPAQGCTAGAVEVSD